MIDEKLINVPDLETRPDLRPEWDEKRQAVYIPAIRRWVDAEDLEDEALDWEHATMKAMKAGKRLPTREEALALSLYAKDINDILAEHGRRPLSGWYWCGSCTGKHEAWYVWFPNREIYWADKYERRHVRCVCD